MVKIWALQRHSAVRVTVFWEVYAIELACFLIEMFGEWVELRFDGVKRTTMERKRWSYV